MNLVCDAAAGGPSEDEARQLITESLSNSQLHRSGARELALEYTKKAGTRQGLGATDRRCAQNFRGEKYFANAEKSNWITPRYIRLAARGDFSPRVLVPSSGKESRSTQIYRGALKLPTTV